MVAKYGERYFFIKKCEDTDKLNNFLAELEAKGYDYGTDYEDIGSGNEIAVLVNVSWDETE